MASNSSSSSQSLHATKPGSGGGYTAYSEWRKLASAIVKQAVEDYVSVLRKLWKNTSDSSTRCDYYLEKKEIEVFFYSEWYEMLTDIDPDSLMSQCRVIAEKQEKDAIMRENKKKVSNILREIS